MSLYGALYSSVSGIQSQSTAIGIISDNISNISTIGYKAGSQYFGTLVTNSGSTASYSPGGVRAQNRQLISQQGLIQASNSPLDIAVSGNGMFVVQDSAESDATTMFTRAGSFKKDSQGRFVNAAGLYLMAWPLDSDGAIPSGSSALSSLDVVDIKKASGNASGTTTVEVGLNLKADEDVFAGSGLTLKPGSDSANAENADINATTIIIPNANLAQTDTITVALDDGNTSIDFEYGGIEVATQLTSGSPILGASDADDKFSSAVAPSTGVESSFTITRSADSANPLSFKYVSSGAVAKDGTFSTLEELRDAINAQSGLTARIVDDTLYIAPEDATEGLTFANTATGGGSNFVSALGLANTSAASGKRFATLQGLADQVNQTTTLTASLKNPTTKNASIEILNADPLTNISFEDNDAADTVLTEFGITDDVVDPSYDAAQEDTNMASGAITPHFVRTTQVYDSQGTAHDVKLGFLKVGANTWRAEMYVNEGDTTDDDNMIASGEITFNGDGSLASVDFDPSIEEINFNWSNGAEQSTIEFNFGTAGQLGTGKTDGIRQFAGTDYNVFFINQNGAQSGLLDSVTIDKEGFIIANYSNGQTQKLYKIPLAVFQNPDGLQTKNGNAFIQTFSSGAINLAEAGSNGAGSISPSSLESANSELSEELTDMIVAQRAYQASAKVITTANDLLDELNRVTG